MKAKIIKSIHSGVRIGSVGEIKEELGGGCAIEVDWHRTTLFGGGDAIEKAVMYFGNEEFERLPEVDETATLASEQSSPQFSVTVVIEENSLSFKLHLPEGEDVLLPGTYFATLANVEDKRQLDPTNPQEDASWGTTHGAA